MLKILFIYVNKKKQNAKRRKQFAEKGEKFVEKITN